MKTIENRNETLMINNITNLNNTTPDIVKRQTTKQQTRQGETLMNIRGGLTTYTTLWRG